MTDAALIGPLAPPDLHVMTYNIRRRMPQPGRRADRWDVRSPFLRALLQAERPTLLGVQEALPTQARLVHAALGDRYHWIGHGRRADRRGEGCPLYYDGDRLELLVWEQTALSDRPTESGSSTWGNMVPRVVVRAEFLDRATGVRFVAINTHFDHLSRRSRMLSARAVRMLVTDAGLPAIVTGDLNTGEKTRALAELLEGGALVDAWTAAKMHVTPRWGTFPNYRAPKLRRKRIDWIAVTPSIEVVEAGINNRRFGGGWGSDHLPVQAILRLPTPGAPAA